MDKRRLDLWLLCVAVMTMAAGCSEYGDLAGFSAIVTPSKDPLTPRSQEPCPGFDIPDCLIEQDPLPALCGIIPGRATMNDVREKVGEPGVEKSGGACDDTSAPKRGCVDTCWGYPAIGVYFDDELVVDVDAVLCFYELTLHEAVGILGPPERVILVHLFDPSPPLWEKGPSDWAYFRAYFLWPRAGIYLQTPIQGVGLGEVVPPFPAGLSLERMVTFEPCTLEELEKLWKGIPRCVSVEWPGMRE